LSTVWADSSNPYRMSNETSILAPEIGKFRSLLRPKQTAWEGQPPLSFRPAPSFRKKQKRRDREHFRGGPVSKTMERVGHSAQTSAPFPRTPRHHWVPYGVLCPLGMNDFDRLLSVWRSSVGRGGAFGRCQVCSSCGRVGGH
jgi:hypothetical protein